MFQETGEITLSVMFLMYVYVLLCTSHVCVYIYTYIEKDRFVYLNRLSQVHEAIKRTATKWQVWLQLGHFQFQVQVAIKLGTEKCQSGPWIAAFFKVPAEMILTYILLTRSLPSRNGSEEIMSAFANSIGNLSRTKTSLSLVPVSCILWCSGLYKRGTESICISVGCLSKQVYVSGPGIMNLGVSGSHWHDIQWMTALLKKTFCAHLLWEHHAFLKAVTKS